MNNMSKVRHCIGLLNSMILSGEDHDEDTRSIVDEALKIAWSAEKEISTAIDLTHSIEELEGAWDKFNNLHADYCYHLEEGGVSEVTKPDVDNAWSRIENAIKTLSKSKTLALK